MNRDSWTVLWSIDNSKSTVSIINITVKLLKHVKITNQNDQWASCRKWRKANSVTPPTYVSIYFTDTVYEWRYKGLDSEWKTKGFTRKYKIPFTFNEESNIESENVELVRRLGQNDSQSDVEYNAQNDTESDAQNDDEGDAESNTESNAQDDAQNDAQDDAQNNSQEENVKLFIFLI